MQIHILTNSERQLEILNQDIWPTLQYPGGQVALCITNYYNKTQKLTITPGELTTPLQYDQWMYSVTSN